MIRPSFEGSRPKDRAEITIKLANSYQTSLTVQQAEEENPKQQAAVQQLLCIWCVQSTTVAVVWKQILLAHTDAETTTITILWL